MAFSFYSTKAKRCLDKVSLSDEYKYIIWRPSITNLCPPGTPFFPFFAWWLFHYLHIFSNKDYCVLLILHDNNVVHRSLITPKYFRFPFMGNNDLQLGDIWTDPAFRGQGLATAAISYIFNHFEFEGIKLWYVVQQNNLPSIKLAEKNGFSLDGKGERHSLYGIPLLGYYNLSINTNFHDEDI